MTDSYLIPDLPRGEFHRVEETIRGSRFIATAAHTPDIESAKAFIESIRNEHARATHNCWAFQAGAAGTSAQVGASDDGEPKGTAGRPMLTVLMHSGVGEVSVVVTRYFGGTLLGTGGLVRAYQGLVRLALDSLPTRIKEPCEAMTVVFAPSHTGIVLAAAEKFQARILEKRFGFEVEFALEVPIEGAAGFKKRLTELSGGTIRFL